MIRSKNSSWALNTPTGKYRLTIASSSAAVGYAQQLAEMDRVGEITVGLTCGYRLHRQDVFRRGDFDDESRTDPLTTGVVVRHRRHEVPHTFAEPVPVEAEPACDYRRGAAKCQSSPPAIVSANSW